MKKLEIISQSQVNEVINNRRLELLQMGYLTLSKNIFINNRDIIVLKSMVKTTNSSEIQFLSLKKDMYYQLQNKSITIEIFERNCYRSIKIKKYDLKVQSLTPTGTFRNRKHKTYRYSIDEKISPSNRHHQPTMYDKRTA